MRTRLTTILLFLFALPLTACGGGMELPHAKPYEVIKVEKASNSRHWETCAIFAPEAKTRDEFAHTVMKAALDIQKETSAKVIVVKLEEDPRVTGKGVLLGVALYAPDGGGISGDQGWTWDVKAEDKRHTEDELRATILWYRNRDRFQMLDSYGGTYTDEEALFDFIGKTMGISPKDVHLAYWFASGYMKK
ncbi:MAG: DUF4875 domain-containing protein [Desulfovibrio sp.]